MKKGLIVIWITSQLLGLTDRAPAHMGERIYPIYELTDEDVVLIDLHDGSIDDWLDTIGEANVTALDFTGDYDPADFEFRVWLAWHRSTNRIYGAMQQADDAYLDEFERIDLSGMRFDTTIGIGMDGDHIRVVSR